jgi:hypothetical protein
MAIIRVNDMISTIITSDANLDEDEVKSTHQDYEFRPDRITVGYYSNIKESDLRTYLVNHAEKTLNPYNAAYKIKKWRGGFLWELQESTTPKSCLESIAKEFDSKDEGSLVIATNGRKVKVILSKKDGWVSVDSYMLIEDDDQQCDHLVFDAKMAPIYPSGESFFRVNLIIFFISFFCLASALQVKHLLINKEVDPIFEIKEKIEPLDKIKELERISYDSNRYIKELSYRNGKWNTEIIDLDDMGGEVQLGGDE